MALLQKTFMLIGGILIIAGLCRHQVDALMLGILLMAGSLLLNPVSIDKEKGSESEVGS